MSNLQLNNTGNFFFLSHLGQAANLISIIPEHGDVYFLQTRMFSYTTKMQPLDSRNYHKCITNTQSSDPI